MRRFGRAVFFLFLCGFLIPCAHAEKVRHVIDGDTVVLANEQRVRFIGIDAPEIAHPRYGKVGEFYGEEARQYLRERLEGRRVRLEEGYEPYDKYGRRLAFVYLDDVQINREMVEKGYAEAMHHFDYPGKKEFLELEAAARDAGIGMWNEKESVVFSPYASRGGAGPGLVVLLILAAPAVWYGLRGRFR